jgi:phosphate starvation-inducible membrane PsiE
MLLGVGFISSALAWLLIAPPVLTLSSTAKHAEHFGVVYVHVLGGTLMLFLGLANLYSGTTRRRFKSHTLLGRIYLIGGGIGAMAAILITSTSAHKSPGVILTNTSISLLTLAAAWLLAAAMAYRAVRNRRIDSHQEWVIRSYVLAWSFVFCRLVSRVPGVDDLAGGDAFIWLSWVGPLLVGEVALQWQRGATRPVKSTP